MEHIVRSEDDSVDDGQFSQSLAHTQRWSITCHWVSFTTQTIVCF